MTYMEMFTEFVEENNATSIETSFEEKWAGATNDEMAIALDSLVNFLQRTEGVAEEGSPLEDLRSIMGIEALYLAATLEWNLSNL